MMYRTKIERKRKRKRKRKEKKAVSLKSQKENRGKKKKQWLKHAERRPPIHPPQLTVEPTTIPPIHVRYLMQARRKKLRKELKGI